VLDHPGTDDGSIGKAKAELTVAINQAAESARKAGKLPGSLESILDEIKEPKVCWKQVLARFLRSNNTDDFSWQKPNRRFIGQGLYLPSMYNPSVDEIAVISDTSGSRTDEELNQDLAEISSIILDTNPTKVHFVEVDTEVQNYTEYTRESLPLKTTMVGRGGTCFSPGIEYINENYPNVSALIYLTDLESNDFGEQLMKEKPLMAKSSKFEQNFKDYGISVLTGGVVLLALLAIASTTHYFITLTSIAFLLGVSIYTIWRNI
jgi:predicted metal-dependent peptidase